MAVVHSQNKRLKGLVSFFHDCLFKQTLYLVLFPIIFIYSVVHAYKHAFRCTVRLPEYAGILIKRF